MQFSNLKIGVRLGAGFAAVLLLILIMVGMGIGQLFVVGNTASQLVEVELAKERLATEWVTNMKQNSIRALGAIKAPDAAMFEMYKKQIAETSAINTGLRKKLEEALVSPEEKALFANTEEKIKAFQAVRNSLLEMRANGESMDTLDQKIQAEFLPAREEYLASVNKLLEFEQGLINTAGADIQRVKNSSSLWLLVLGVISLGLGAFLAWRLSHGITSPLAKAVDVAEAVAGGDLTTKITVDSTDEIGQLLSALKKMNDNLGNIVGEVRNGTDTMATASSEIATGNLDLSSRTEEQASSLEETASAIEELTSTVKQNADNARQANQLAVSASSVAVQGGEVVEQVIATMGSINESSKRIADIIGVIDGIAFQTNILALNAAVEAARAGEQGRGFAVVATEVRSLAQRSANAAKEIKTLIGDSVASVGAGSKLVEQAGTTMSEVVNSVKRVTDIVSEIAAASQEQSIGIEQVNQAIMQMDEVTQQNAALVEEAAAASQSLQDQAVKLAQSVSVFKISGWQAKPTTAAPRTVKAKPAVAAKPKALKTEPTIKPVAAIGAASTPALAVSGDEWTEF
ncbi:methyl-accepting chemotaxis protein [Methylobacillus arboreus]|uniref:methyl-accepting chemotaxis protein n=1 Tax=Methylobacillus arboreus TaxID=755170 RepID=UPI001E35BB3C|nr:methyl-accepting chemotaxis protein [Methylobacillus arboreus]MCB5190362.1 methyl-accepting chemotaxis protein [Methylobacillus arboreus]